MKRLFSSSVPTLLLSGMSLGTPGAFWACFWVVVFVCFVFLTQAYFHVRLDCLMHHSWRDTVLYYQQPTGATGPSEPIKDQDTMLTQPQDNILQSYLCSASLVSLQPSLRWLCTTLCLPNKGGPGRGLALPTATPCLLNERKRKKRKSLLLYTLCSWSHRALTALTVYPIVLTINTQHSAVTSQLETI